MWKTFRWLISERSLGWWKTAPSRYRVKLIFWHLYVPVHYQPPCLFLTDAKAQWNGERKLGKFWTIEVLLFLFASLSIIYNMCYVKPAHFLILATFRYYLLPCYSNDPVKLNQNFQSQTEVIYQSPLSPSPSPLWDFFRVEKLVSFGLGFILFSHAFVFFSGKNLKRRNTWFHKQKKISQIVWNPYLTGLRYVLEFHTVTFKKESQWEIRAGSFYDFWLLYHNESSMWTNLSDGHQSSKSQQKLWIHRDVSFFLF